MPEDGLRLRGSLRIVVERANGQAEESFAKNLILNQGMSWLLWQLISINQAAPGCIGPLPFAGINGYIQFGSRTDAPNVTQTGVLGKYPPANTPIVAQNGIYNVTTGLSQNPPFCSFIFNISSFTKFTFVNSFPLTIGEAELDFCSTTIPVTGIGSYPFQAFARATFATTQLQSNDSMNVTWTISG